MTRLVRYLIAAVLGIAFTIALLYSLTGCDTAPSTGPWLPIQGVAATSWDGGTACWIVDGIVKCQDGGTDGLTLSH